MEQKSLDATELLPQVEAIVDFWLSQSQKWFVKDKAFDDLITEKFLALYQLVLTTQLQQLTTTATATLGIIILLDQFPRNMFRDTTKAYASDYIALSLAKDAVNRQLQQQLSIDATKFLYMPFQHSESLQDQQTAVELYTSLGDEGTTKYAKLHLEIIEKFGRFPHRNKILGRISTADEIEFLKQPGSGF